LLRGQADIEPEAFEAAGRSSADPLEWLRDGVIGLAETLTRTPAATRAMVFLNDAPAPREFWARRQCHETTMHAVDALSASLGRLPAAKDTWIATDIAVDGVDELLGGFLTQRRSRRRSDEDAVLVVAPDDVPDGWRVDLGPGPAVTTRCRGPREPEPDWELEGTAVDLYLSLWNRAGAPVLGDTWRERAAVTWS